MASKRPKTIAAYIAAAPANGRAHLTQLHGILKGVAPKAVILPSDLAFDPPEALRKWLDKFGGNRIAVPRPAGDWIVASATPQNAANQAAQLVRQLAEGQEVRQKGPSTGWMVVIYVAASLFGLILLFLLIGSVGSLLSQ